MQEIPNTKYQILNTEPKYIPLSEAGKILNTSRDYMNVLVRRGKLRAVKLGRNWVTTREWIGEYVNSVGRTQEFKNLNISKFQDFEISKFRDSNISRFQDLDISETEEFRNLKSGLILEREKILEAKALIPEIKLSSRELHVEERKNILELVSNRFKKVDASEFEKASRRFGILKSLRHRSGLRFGVASGLVIILFMAVVSFTDLNILKFQYLNISQFKNLKSPELQASIFSDVFKNFPNDIPLFSRWFTLSLSKGFAFLKLKTPSELVLGELSGGEPKIIKPQEAPPRIDTFDEALALDSGADLSAGALAKAEGEEGGASVSASAFTLIENRLSVVEANLKEQNALTQSELSLQKKTILGTLETLIGISKLLPTYPISTIVVQGQPATLTTYSVQPQVNTGFDRLSADYFTLAHDATINGHLTVRSGGEFNTLSVSGATTLTGNTTVGGTLNVAGDTTLGNVTVNGIFTAPNVSLTNASTTYLTVSNTSWIKEIFATQNLSVATTSASNALTVQGNTFLYGGLGVGMATTTSGAIQTTGDVFVGRNLYVSGNSTTIGQSSSDTLVVNSSVGSNLVPTLNNWYNLGSPSFYWGDAYIDTLNVNNISAASTTIGGTESATFTINTDNESIDQENMNLVFFRGTVPPNAVISWNAATSSKRFEFNQAARFFNESASTTNPVLTVQGNTGLTANAFQVLDVTTTTVLFSVNPVSQKTTMVNASTTNLTVSGNLWAGASGAFMLADGTVSNPALAFAADTDTGLFRIGDGKMSFGTNATTSLTLDTGKVIVGNDLFTASYQLEVADRDTNNSTIVDELRLSHFTTGTAANGLGTGLLFYGQDAEGSGQNLARIAAVVEQATSSATFKSGLAFSTVGSGGLLEKMRIDNSGNVGIGTTSPAGVLSIAKADSSGVTDFLVNPTVKTSGNLLDLEVGGSSLFRVASNGAVFGTGSIQITYGSVFKDSLSANFFMPSDGFGSMFIANNAGGGNGNIQFQTMGASLLTRMVVTSTGQVGIGSELSPANALTVNGALSVGNSSYNVTAPTNGAIIQGNVGIGTTTPSNLLSLAATTTPSIGFSVRSNTLETGFWTMGVDTADANKFKIASSTSSLTTNTRLTIDGSGNVGIASTSPSAVLSVNVSNATGVANALNITSATSSLLYVRSDGNVGIGATNPDNGLTLGDRASDETGSSQNLSFRVSNGSQSGIIWKAADYPKASAKIDTIGTGSWVTKGLAFYTSPWWDTTTSVVERVRITEVGNVGIGTSTPLAQLSVQMNPSGVGYFVPSDLFVLASSTTSGVVTTHFLVTGAGNVGIGTTSPVSLLSVNGNTRINGSLTVGTSTLLLSSNYIENTSSGGTLTLRTNSADRLVIDNSGNVGIGTTTPGALLDVYKTGANDPLAQFGSAGVSDAQAVTFRNGSGELDIFIAGGSGEFMNGTTQGDVGMFFTSGDDFFLGNKNAAPYIVVKDGGNVGIGTTTPDYKLHVEQSDGNMLKLNRTSGGNWIFDITNSYGLAVGSLNIMASDASRDLGFRATNSGNAQMVLLNNGNVGIGTTTPANGKLEVVGGNATLALRQTSSGDYTGIRIFNDQNSTIRTLEIDYSGSAYASALLTNGPSGESASIGTTGAYPLAFGTNNTARMTITSGGNVGIGTSTPSGHGSGAAGPFVDLFKDNGISEFYAGSNVTTDAAALGVYGGYNSGSPAADKRLGIMVFSNDGSNAASTNGQIDFYTNNGGSITQKMVIDKTGNVGIGTTTPGQKLSVTGNIVASGCISAYSAGGTTNGTCADIAESYFSGDDLTPADIIAVKSDPASPEGFSVVRATSTSAIIGVVSTRPAIYMQGDSALFGGSNFTASSTFPFGSWVPLALAGRVPVKVSLENGPIAIGDRIGASSVPGVGMKMTAPTASGVGAPTESVGVGIALEPYDGTQGSPTSESAEVGLPPGVGKILVFVNLGEPRLAASQGTGDLAEMTANTTSLNSDLNLNGFSILNVKSIAGMNGLWRIDEGGNITAQSVETQKLTIGGGAASGVTVYDRTTAAPKCIYIEGGVIKTSDGACGTTTNAGTEATIVNNESGIMNNGNTETATTTPTLEPTLTATTTEPVLTATTTEPILTSTSTTEILPVSEPVVATTTEAVIVSTTTAETATSTP